MADINKLKALAEAACPRDEWYAQGDLRFCDDKTGETHGLHHHDAAFVESASPAAVLELIAERSALAFLLKRFVDGEHDQEECQSERHSYHGDAETLLAKLSGEFSEHALVSDEALRAEYARRQNVIAERDQLKADNEALRKDAERYRWLREQEALEGGIAILPVGLWVKPAMLCATPFDSGEMTDSVIDAAMSEGEQP